MFVFIIKRPTRTILATVLACACASLAASQSWAQAGPERPALPYPDKATVLDQCGPIDDSQHVEFYDGQLGVSKQYVAGNQPSTLQLQWLGANEIRAKLPGYEPGNVAGARWCSGTLVDDRHVLTAGHCFDINDGTFGWVTPWKLDGAGNVTYATPEQIARVLKANFNYQLSADTGALRKADVYPIVKLLEWREGPASLDYAIFELGASDDGHLPGSKYKHAELSIQDPKSGDLISVIQHPNGDPKKIEAGKLSEVKGAQLLYKDLDTFGGSSGSGVHDAAGTIRGVHTNGGCASGGYNKAVKTSAIAKVSKFLSNWND